MVLHQCTHNTIQNTVQCWFSRSFHCTTTHHRCCHSNSNYSRKRFRTINAEKCSNSRAVLRVQEQINEIRAQDISFHLTSHPTKMCVCAMRYRIFKMHTNQTIKKIIAEKKTVLIQCRKAKKKRNK